MTNIQSIRECWPEILTGLNEGTQREVWEACREGGFPGTFESFKTALRKVRKENAG